MILVFVSLLSASAPAAVMWIFDAVDLGTVPPTLDGSAPPGG